MVRRLRQTQIDAGDGAAAGVNRLAPAIAVDRVDRVRKVMSMQDADTIIRALDLAPHPEGGWFREVHRDLYGTAIYYLLKHGETSRWHRIAQNEMWHYYTGVALELLLSPDGTRSERHVLGPNIAKGERPHLVVPPRVWQTARSLGAWSLAGCTVVPPFDFADFELAPDGWEPSG